jgi:uncharacterized protein DUF2793/peptidase G2-like protein
MPGNPADNSAILALPYIQPSQSQKHVTHNEAISTLDVLVQLVVAGFGATTPPADPAPGDVHALGATPTGAWAGQDNTLATWHDGAWVFITPLAGWRAWGVSEAELRIWDGAAWGLPKAGMDNLGGVGINTTADATNRLSVSAPATLLSHEGSDHQLKINKAGDTDTASLLFQSGWTGHAEMGLSGSTDFAIKVSDDGTTWNEALVFDGASGTASGTAIQSGAKDATPGKLMKTGAFGVGATAGVTLTDMDDTSVAAGMYSYTNTVSGTLPSGATSYGFVLVHRQAIAGISQTLFNSNGMGVYLRTATSGTWSPWRKFAMLNDAGDLNIDSGSLFVDVSTNNVGVGTPSPTSDFTVGDGTSFVVAEIHADATPTLVLNNEATASGFSRITFETAGAYVGRIAYSHQFDYMGFNVNGSESVRIDNAGNMGIGTTAANAARVHSKTTSTSDKAFNGEASSAAYTGDVLRLSSGTTAGTGYNFARMYSSGGDLEFKLSGDGNGTCDGSWTGGGADYAEYFEWLDGNPMAEDRRGISVVLEGDKIREALAGEEPIGVISGNPSVVGDAAPFRWSGKYLRDDFRTVITEDYEAVSWTAPETTTKTETEQATEVQEYTEKVVDIADGVAVQKTITRTRDVPLFDEYPLSDEAGNDLGMHREPRMIEVAREVTKEVAHSYAMDEVPAGITVPKDAVRTTQTRRKLNPDYTPGTGYTPREDRPEWDTVGLMGKLRIRNGQAIGAGWVRMRAISDTIEEWLVR